MRRSEKNPWLEVVGVAGDVRYRGLDRPAPDTVHLTWSEALAPFMSRDAYFLVRSERAQRQDSSTRSNGRSGP